MNDGVAFVAVVVAFAIAVTAHVTIVFGLARRHPRWRAAAAFFVVPLAPYWALREKMRARAAMWIVGVVGYVVARALAR